MITELGSTISATLQNLFKGPVNDEAIENTLKSICTSLIKSNVNPKLVSELRVQIKEQISKEKMENTANKAKIVHRIFFDSLVKFLDPEPSHMKSRKEKLISSYLWDYRGVEKPPQYANMEISTKEEDSKLE